MIPELPNKCSGTDSRQEKYRDCGHVRACCGGRSAIISTRATWSTNQDANASAATERSGIARALALCYDRTWLLFYVLPTLADPRASMVRVSAARLLKLVNITVYSWSVVLLVFGVSFYTRIRTLFDSFENNIFTGKLSTFASIPLIL